MSTNSFFGSVKNLFIGRSRDLSESGLFHKLSLAALLAWVGLGADGLSSSCYGPEEAFRALLAHPSLALLVAAMSAITIILICASYAQIIEQFPSGGGGYLVATRLLSPAAGVVSGSALLIDYVLTISISVASAMDAVYSFLPPEWLGTKLLAGCVGIIFLTLLNLRGVRESVVIWVPVFFVFLISHTFAVVYAIAVHASGVGAVFSGLTDSVRTVSSDVGWLGLGGLLLRAYSMGAGTYTGIEAVSNGLPILREPRVRTGKRTMLLMALSLGGMVAGLLVAYLVVGVAPVEGKTLNAVLLEAITRGWPAWLGSSFVKVALTGAAALLFIAAQAGFLDGPRVLASMALDKWMPARFAALSDRFVTLNGIVLMGVAALVVLMLTRGAVSVLVVLYSINVFVTFCLSQAGMVRHWWLRRHDGKPWRRRLAVNASGLAMTLFILVTLVVLKFGEGGWVTILTTAALVAAAFGIRRHYVAVQARVAELDKIVTIANETEAGGWDFVAQPGRGPGRTAVFFVNGFNGLGLHTLLGAVRLFGGGFSKFVFVQVGVVDAGNFKDAENIEQLRTRVADECGKYVSLIQRHGGVAESVTSIGQEVVSELEHLLPDITARHPRAVFFSGQLVFERESIVTRLLHNYTAFSLQRRLFLRGLPCAVVPIRIGALPAV